MISNKLRIRILLKLIRKKIDSKFVTNSGRLRLILHKQIFTFSKIILIELFYNLFIFANLFYNVKFSNRQCLFIVSAYIKRVIVHPSFHNISFKECEKLMAGMDQGEVIIRPSSKVTENSLKNR